MAIYQLENDEIIVGVESFGAELKSLQRKSRREGLENIEYLWNADPRYWKRTSPVLFPVVGSLKNQSYRYEGQTYQMPQHGFARDMEFTLEEHTKTRISFVLRDTEETLQKYPFHFALHIAYEIEGTALKVIWKVENTNDKTMYFSIGAHPAFLCPLLDGTDKEEYALAFDTDKNIVSGILAEDSTLGARTKEIVLENGILQTDDAIFDEGALVIENDQAHEVAMLLPDGTPYLAVAFDAPLFGIWSPAGMNAPFICIEPWYGRCDKFDFDGELADREWGNELAIGETFEADYVIKVGK